MNSVNPSNPETEILRQELEAKYNVPVIGTNCAQLRIEDLNNIMERVLLEFPISEIGVNIPKWIESLDESHWLKVDMINAVKEVFSGITRIREIKGSVSRFDQYEFIKRAYIDSINLGSGAAYVEINEQDGLLYRILSEVTGLEIDGEHRLISLLTDLAKVKKEYDKVQEALNEVKLKGYGIVSPQIEEMSLEEPEIIKQGSRFGVKLRASAPSIHMIRADIETEIAPLVGTEKQSEELVSYLLKEFESEPEKLWQSNIFGKSLHELVSEGLQNKLYRMPEDAQLKLQETLQKIINEGSGGLICIIL